MSNPFNYGGWLPSLQTYDLCSGTQMGAMNIMMNMCMDDSIARQGFYSVPMANFTNFTPYSSPFSYNYLCDPRYTIGQMDYMNKMQGGSGFINSNGQFQLPTFNNSGNIWNSFGYNPSGTTGNNSSGTETDEDKAKKAKFNKITSFIKKLAAYKELDSEDKQILNNIIQHNYSKMSWDEKLNYVKTEYNKISKSTVKDFILESGDALKVDGTNGTNICDALSEDGYEFQSDKKIKKSDINDLESAIDEISSNNVNSDSQKIIGSLSSSKGDYPILDVVSRWNTEHAGDDKSKRNIIAFITSKYNSIKDDPDNIMKDDVKKLWAAPLVNKLIDKAENLKGNKVLSTEFKNKISKAIDNLSNEFKASGMSSKLADAFDELYLYSRQASILITRNEINKYYGEIDPDLFNDSLFAAETEADLKEEGFSADQINRTKGSLDPNKKAKVSINNKEASEFNDLDDELTTMDSTKFESLKKLNGFPDEVEEAYIENYPENSDAPKVYIVKTDENGKETIEEITNIKLENGEYKLTSGDAIKTKTVKASAIQDNANTVKEKKEKQEAIETTNKAIVEKMDALVSQDILVKNADGTYETKDHTKLYLIENGELYVVTSKTDDKFNLTTKTKVDVDNLNDSTLNAKDNGKKVYDLLHKWGTDSFEYNTINKAISSSSLNKDNIIDFLEGFYEGNSHEGIIEYLDDEGDDKYIEMENKKNVINSLLDKAKECGLENDSDYQRIKDVMSLYESGKEAADRKNFNRNYTSYWNDICSGTTAAGVSVGGLVGVGGAIAAGLSAGPIGLIAVGAALAGGAIATACDRTTDNEVIDRAMKNLYEKIKAKK